jgi:3-dehydroquinate dehydratase-2
LKKVIVINGPNLNLLGKRQPEVYGSKSFEEFFEELKADYSSFDIDYYQSNVEGELVNKLHQVGFSYDGIVFNAGGYTHTSVAIADAVASIETPTIEVHISNVYSREEYRHHSLMAANCKGVIAGFGLESYRLALNSLV